MRDGFIRKKVQKVVSKTGVQINVRSRRAAQEGRLHAQGGPRRLHVHGIALPKAIVFGLITLDGEGFFQRYGSFTGKEFVEFLKAAHAKGSGRS